MPRSINYIGATGIGVSDLEASAKFYEAALGMVRRGDLIVLPYMEEIILTHPGRNSVVLMHWTDGSARNYRDVPVKLVFYVADPVATMDKIRNAGGAVTREPAMGKFGMVGLAKDLDGYVVELLQAPPPKD